MSSKEEVLEWLNTQIEQLWADPSCGDGKCEEPTEFASYGRFGCQADCQALSSRTNVTRLQIDFWFDFRHDPQVASLFPATRFLEGTSWNLCPTNGSHALYIER